MAAAHQLALTQPAFAQPTDDEAMDDGPTDDERGSPEGNAAIEPPQQTKFVEAEYPQKARAAGVEANVVLRLHIDAEGTVTEVSIEQGAGEGFDQAAAAAARQFRFTPARQAGRPVGAVILYEYRFTLEGPSKASPAEERAVPLANISVRLTGSGVPLAGATVTLRGADGRRLADATNEAGEARFDGIDPGAYRVEVVAAGFEPYSSEESLDADRETQVSYALVPSAEGIEVVVQGEVQRDVTVRRISRDELRLVAGGAGDPIRVIESLPGVARTSDGSLVIRGAQPLLSGVMIDGMPVPFLYHNYQITSVVPADMVSDVTLYPGNFGVRYGRYIGGVVEVGLASPDTRCHDDYGKVSTRTGCYHGLAQADFIEGRLMLQGPVPFTKRWSFAASGRRSWLDVLLKKAMDATDLKLSVAPRYYDAYGIVEYTGDNEKLSLRAYGSQDEIALLLGERAAQDVTEVGRFEFEYGFSRYQALYNRKLGNGIELSSMLGVGRDHTTLISDDIKFVQRSTPIAFRHSVSAELSPMVGIVGGVDLFTQPYKLEIRARQTDALTPVETERVDSTDATFAVFAEVPFRPTERTSIIPGVRLAHTPLFEETTFSPRLLARYDLIQRPNEKWMKRLTLKSGVGRYHQAPPVILRYFDDNTDQQSMRAWQFSLGAEQDLHDKLELSLEGFVIDRDRLFSSMGQEDGSTRVKNEGRGNTVGLETFLRYHSDKHFFGWVAYTLSKTWERSGPDEPRHPPDFDQTHNLILVGSVDVGRGWRLGARFRYVTGNPFTDIARPPYAASLFDGQSGDNVPQTTAVNAERLPDVHQLDLRADKKWQFRHWALSTYLDVRNAYNHRVVDYYLYNFDYSRRAPFQALPVLPSLGVRGEF